MSVPSHHQPATAIGDPTLPAIPADLRIRTSTWTPVDDAQLVHDHPVEAPTYDAAAAHPLVVLGDSLSHGFKSLAIHDTQLSWPAQVAGAMGLTPDQFRHPEYPGPIDCPGIPLNLEALLRDLEHHAGSGGPLLGEHTPELAILTMHLLREVKHYWEDGDRHKVDPDPLPMHNLAIYGWDVRDALTKSRQDCQDNLEPPPLWRRMSPHRPGFKVSHDGDRAALRVLTGSGGGGTTLVGAAERLGTEGIGTLIVALGANNALPSVLKMKLVWTPEDYLSWSAEQKLAGKNDATVWRPSHFEADYEELFTRVKAINARHVILTTVPHVTVAPLLHGVGSKPVGSRYFARYSRVWVPDAEFDANSDECLSGEACRQIDSAIDAYNDVILSKVIEARQGGADWHLFDMCALLDRLAYRRYYEDDSARPDTLPASYPLPEALQRLSPWPDTRFFGSDRYGRVQGGLIALDGIHPTTTGYGIVAHEVLKILAGMGVVAAGTDVDWDALLENDTLVRNPPRTLSADLGLLGQLYTKYEDIRSLIHG